MKKTGVLLIVLICFILHGFGQARDTLSMPDRLNTLSFNPTPMLLCNSLKNITFVYERMVQPNQSLVIQLGYLEISPTLLDSINTDGSIRQKTNFGLNAAVQYRFYPTRLNAQPAPFGLYYGPYASYYGINTTSIYTMSASDPTQAEEIKTNFNMLNLGIGVGYQFVIKDKISIDLLAFGPSLTYSFKNKKSSAQVSESEEVMISDLVERSYAADYPLLGQFINLYGNDSSTSFSMFFRYAITVGYRF